MNWLLIILFSFFITNCGATLPGGLTSNDGPIFSFAQISDEHAGQVIDPSLTRFRLAVSSINKHKPDFVVSTGDMTEGGLHSEYDQFFSIWNLLDIKGYLVPGNHELNYPSKPDYQEKLERFKDRAGPLDNYFEHKGYLFITLNNNPEDHYGSEMWLTDAQYEWLSNLLDKKLPTIILTHIPPLFDGYYMEPGPNAKRFISFIEDKTVIAVLSGHLHRFKITDLNGIRYFICPDLKAVGRDDWVMHDVYEDRVEPRMINVYE